MNTQAPARRAGDVGAAKVEVLRNRVFRAVEIEIEAVNKDFTERTARSLLKGAAIVVDTFDNSASRQLVQQQCREATIDCLHAGLYADYCETIWDERYRVPGDVAGDVCEYPLARNLVLFAVALASELLIRFVLNAENATTRERSRISPSERWSIEIRRPEGQNRSKSAR